MVDVARVNLYGHPIGSVRWDQRYEIAQYEYEPENRCSALYYKRKP